jgi:enoyl-CoA hydratase/carnithine racemase
VSLVLFDKQEHVARIRLNRPEARNALTPELLDELEAAVRTASTDRSVRVVVVAGDHLAFSAGADLKTVTALFESWPDYIAFLHRLHDVFRALEETAVPTIAKVRGYALAGGLELLLCCDLAIASDDARIGDQHANYGLMAGAGGIPRLVRRIGLQRALELMYTGRWLTGREAAQLGIVLRSVPDDQLDTEVDQLALQIAGKSRTGLRYMKGAARAGLDLALEGALRIEQAALIEYFTSSDDPKRGLQAFLRKEAPKFPD